MDTTKSDLIDRFANVKISDDVWSDYLEYFTHANENPRQPGFLTVQGLVALNLLAVGEELVFRRKKKTTLITIQKNPNVVLSANGLQDETPSGILRKLVGKLVPGAWVQIKTQGGTTLQKLRSRHRQKLLNDVYDEIEKVVPDAWQLSTVVRNGVFRVIVYAETWDSELRRLRSTNAFFRSKYVELINKRNPPVQLDGGGPLVQEGAGIFQSGQQLGTVGTFLMNCE